MVAALLFYLGLGALLTLEEAGAFFLPGDISLVAAGLHASQGDSIVFASWAIAAVAMTVGASLLYHAVDRYPGSERVMPKRVIGLIHNHGAYGVAVARLVPGLRNATVFAAASAELPFRTFLVGLIPAAILWSGLLLALGWFFGGAALAVLNGLHASWLLRAVSICLLLAAAIFVFVRLRTGRDTESPDALRGTGT